ncbi:hypothetical protein AVEN_68062-1 [Araneus ventricosus]|uniref:Integrase zinc-binding domain-containing protein n=1 Tax=Araneus ventricosus TaxID=182803 RepID=A0A4Y2M8L9_ARAVE|nr:hypothetical protein AVEN_68062-1 [Araneus ventricosus]
MKTFARCYVWWPKIEDIENHGLCEPCQQTTHAPPRAPVHPREVTTKPWSRVYIDFAGTFQGQMFFLLVDSFSKWLEVKRLSSVTSSATIKVTREIFAIHEHITPSAATGFSPVELLTKRRLGTVLDLLYPDLVEDRKRKNEELLDQRLSKGQLRSFSLNDAVYIKNHSSGPTLIPRTVIEKTGPLSYKNITPNGKSIRCHIDQMRNRKTSLARPQSSPETR